jgi:sugar lactone lactonase YvrE
MVMSQQLNLGEGSLWCPRIASWLLVDIHGRAVYTLDHATFAARKYAVPEQVGTVVLRAPEFCGGGGEQALVALKTGLAFLDLRTGAVARLPGAPAEPPKNRWNDGKCSPEGRFWGGTMEDATFSKGVGSLYVLDGAPAGAPPPSPRKAFGGVTISNGIAWSADGRTMFYIDTPRNDVQVRSLTSPPPPPLPPFPYPRY